MMAKYPRHFYLNNNRQNDKIFPPDIIPSSMEKYRTDSDQHHTCTELKINIYRDLTLGIYMQMLLYD